MGKPQLEDGYTKIANELLEALFRTKLSDSEHRIMLFAIRYTYGFKRKSAVMSMSYIAEGTGLDRRRVVEAMRALKLKNMLVVTKSALGTESGLVQINEITIQKNYIEWRLVTKNALVRKTMGVVTKSGKGRDKKQSGLGTKNAPKKEITKKERKKEGNKNFVPPTLEQVREYCTERKNNINPQEFIDFYETSNWYRGKTKIKDWKACVRTWEKRQPKKSKSEDYDIGI